MLTQKTVIDQIEITRNGTVQVRFGKLLLNNGVEIMRLWHRTSIAPGQDLDHTLKAVNAHLISMGEMAVDEAASIHSQLTPQFLREKVLMIHTPEMIRTYQEAQDRNNAALKPVPTLMQRIVSALTP